MILDVKNIDKSYNTKKVLNDVTFSLKEGQFTAIIGNNGVGKTTLFRILCGLISYDAGEVQYFGKPMQAFDSWHRKELGIIFSDSFYIEDFTVLEYLFFVGKFQKISTDSTKERSNELLKFLRLESSAKKRIKELSTGNQKRVSIAASLIHEPKVLLYDEPFLGLDVETTQNVCSLLSDLKGRKSLLISSHDLNLISELCDVFLFIDDEGRLHNPIHRSDFKDSSEFMSFIRKEKFVDHGRLNKLNWL